MSWNCSTKDKLPEIENEVNDIVDISDAAEDDPVIQPIS